MKLIHGFLFIVPITVFILGFQLYATSSKGRVVMKPRKMTTGKNVRAPNGLSLPYYFRRYMKTKKLQDLFVDYSKFHKTQMKRLTKNSQQNCAYYTTSPNRGYVVYRVVGSTGLGNNILGIVSTFLIAMLSGRAFLVSWPSHNNLEIMRQVFKHPNMNWDYLDFHTNSAKYKRENCMFDPVTWKNPEPNSYDHMIDIHTFFHTKIHALKPLLCYDTRYHFNSIGDRILFTSNQYMAPLTMLNHQYRELLEQMFPDKDVFGPISRYLLRPTDKIQTEIDDFLTTHDIKIPKVFFEDPNTRELVRKHAGGKNIMYGLQIRRNDKEKSWAGESQEPSAFKCLEEKLSDMKAKVPPASLDSYRVLVVTDNSTTKARAKKHFGKLSITYQDGADYTTVRDVSSAAVDIFLLSYCHDMVVTKSSTFGSVAHGRASIVPTVVAHDLDGTSKCVSTSDAYAGQDILSKQDPPCHFMYILEKYTNHQPTTKLWCAEQLN